MGSSGINQKFHYLNQKLNLLMYMLTLKKNNQNKLNNLKVLLMLQFVTIVKNISLVFVTSVLIVLILIFVNLVKVQALDMMKTMFLLKSIELTNTYHKMMFLSSQKEVDVVVKEDLAVQKEELFNLKKMLKN